jgi:putative ABC transport system ATP-binding protein
MLRATQLAYQYPSGAPISLPDLDVPQGSALLLRGSSGSGKSTLLALAAGLLTTAVGQLEVAGQNPALLTAAAAFKRRINGV